MRETLSQNCGWLVRPKKLDYTSLMTLGLIAGAALFLAAAWAGEKHALYIPIVVLVAAAAANVLL